MKRRTLLAGLGGLAATGSVVRPAAAQTVVGVTATEIKIGHTIPYSGNASSYSVGGKSHAAYFKRVNDMGGVGGRKITFISLDDAYNPAKTVEQTRRLVEQDQVALMFNPLGIVIALIFIGLPFVVRTVQPVLLDFESELEEASASLGANRLQVFLLVILPSIMPALLTGIALAFARAVGEYGSVIFIAGNMPMKSEIAPLLIVSKLEQFDYPGAAAIAVVMLAISFVMLLVLNLIQRWARRHEDNAR